MNFSQGTQRLFVAGIILVVAHGATLRAEEPPSRDQRIGFTELRTNLPGGRHANVRTMRAVVARPGVGEGAQQREAAGDLRVPGNSSPRCMPGTAVAMGR
jgi:hypothetical protein